MDGFIDFIKKRDPEPHLYETMIYKQNFWSYGESSEKFYYNSPEGFSSYGESLDGNFEFAKLHFTPVNPLTNARIQNIRQVRENERNYVKKKAVVQFVRGMSNFIDFVESHQQTKLSSVKLFKGYTNEEMARFLKDRLDIETTILIDPDTKNPAYFFVITFEELKERFERLKNSHPNVAKLIEEK